jgi:diguanylate cyclase (GGDEF)-like protein
LNIQSQTRRGRGLTLAAADLATMMPMHLWLGTDGQILSAGPTLVKICPALAQAQPRVLDELRLVRPRRAGWHENPRLLAGGRLHFALTAPPQTALRGEALALPDGQGVLLNLSFGIGAIEAVRNHALTGADFAAADLTVELLYLAEVKLAVTGELAALNARLQDARDTATRQALTDPLTGLANRRGFEAALDRAIAGAGQGRPFALAHLDLDRFKAVNDTLGHAAGDAVLTVVGTILRGATRKHDLVARIGGDEFIMLLRGPISVDFVRRMGRRIISGLERPVTVDGGTARISGSLGVCFSTDYDHLDAEQMLNDADSALYLSKRTGRARLSFWSHGGASPRERRRVTEPQPLPTA